MNLRAQKIEDILNDLDLRDGTKSTPDRGVRVSRRILDLKVELTQPNGNPTEYVVATRNLSSKGMAFLHRNYVHVGSEFSCNLPTFDDGALIHITGKVVRCTHVVSMLHEVAVKFDQSIDLPNFANLSQQEEQECWKEMGTARPGSQSDAEIIGNALVVDDAESQRAIAEVWLKRIGFAVSKVADGASALQAIQSKQIDLVILDMLLGEESGLDVAKQIRNERFSGIIVGVSAETDPELRRGAMTMGCDCFVAKPLTARNLNQAIDSVTGENGRTFEGGAITSSMIEDEAMYPMICDFADSIPELVDQLSAAMLDSEGRKLADLCRSVKADGGALGFWQITEAAEAALVTISAEEAVGVVQENVNQLLQVLRRVSIKSS